MREGERVVDGGEGEVDLVSRRKSGGRRRGRSGGRSGGGGSGVSGGGRVAGGADAKHEVVETAVTATQKGVSARKEKDNYVDEIIMSRQERGRKETYVLRMR